MAKRKRVITAGRLVKEVIYTVPQPRDGERVRSGRSKLTTAAQRALNYRTAQGRLEMLIAANFDKEDLFCTLTYRDDCLPVTLAEAKKILRAFLRLLRRERQRNGLDLKYVYVTEGKHGDKRYHHHLLINATGPHDLEMICSLWKYGDMTEVKRIEGREYIDVARYLTKESLEGKPVGAQMWTRSRNLVLPTVESYFVPDNATVQPPPGAHVLERDEKLNEYGGFIYLKYRLPWDQDISHTSPQQNGKGKRSVEVRKIEVAEKRNGAQSYSGDRRVYPLSSL